LCLVPYVRHHSGNLITGNDRRRPEWPGVSRFAPLHPKPNHYSLHVNSCSRGIGGGKMPTKRDAAYSVAQRRFAELIRAMESAGNKEAALAFFFDHSVTAINNWYGGDKLPKDEDVEEFAKRCGVSQSELLSDDEQVWKAAMARASSEKHVIKTPAWLCLRDRISLTEKSAKANTVVIMTADAYNDTQRRDTQSIVRHNIAMRGITYIYVIPDDCSTLGRRYLSAR
jgi:hypothetical protein